MKTSVYFCNCGTNVSDKIDTAKIAEHVGSEGVTFKTVDFLCSEDGKEFLLADMKESKPDRVVIAACSPREHEQTFMQIMSDAGINPYLMHMVNVREHVAWVTEDPIKATEKAGRLAASAIGRVRLQEPLEKREITINPDVVVIGAGPAGMKAALAIAEAGRKVTLVEKSPLIGGMPVRFEELFPDMECGPCMLEPMMADILHGPHAGNIELMTLSEVVSVVGSYGNFTVTVKQRPRFIDIEKCIGCQECIGPCPVSRKNVFDGGLSERKAVYLPFNGSLPNAPSIDVEACLRTKGEDCALCKDACPVDGTVLYDDCEKVLEIGAGAIVVATGSGLYDCTEIPGLGYGEVQDVYTSEEFERLLASNGPTGGEIKLSTGAPPSSVAIIHCVGSLDSDHKEYCSDVCCQYAFKFNHLIGKKLPGTKVIHLFREISVTGKRGFRLYDEANADSNSVFIKYSDISEMSIVKGKKGKTISYIDSGGKKKKVSADMAILCPAIVPGTGADALAKVLDTPLDKHGFFDEMHNRTDSVQSKIKGILIAGSCRSPMDIEGAISRGMSSAGYALSGLVAGRLLEIDPVNAVVDEEACSGCRVCVGVCPYRAISFDDEKEVARINDVLCQGCGTCVSACPSGVIKGRHFTNAEIIAEIEGALR